MLYSIIEPSCYQRLTNGLAIPRLCRQLGIESRQYTLAEFLERKIDKTSSSADIFITESAFLRTFPLSELRRYIPNGKIVNLGSDSIPFNNKNQDEISNPELVDLWLDTMKFSVDYYNNKGIKSDLWRWTISEAYIDEIEKYKEIANPSYEKTQDFVCLARLNSPYRKMMAQYLSDYNLKGTFGNGSISSDMYDLYKLYAQSIVCIGTTSPAGQDNVRTMKGFRDWIAPFMDTILIYDDNPEMDWAKSILPRYRYDDYNDLITIINSIKISNVCKNITILRQKQFILNHTLEKQFKQLFEKYEIIRRDASECTPTKKL